MTLGNSYQILYYFGFWQTFTCLFAFIGLIAIWYHIGRKKGDFGQVWLALSILCWSISGMVEVEYGHQLSVYLASPDVNDPEWFSSTEATLTGWRSILSLLNSLFILLALPWFRYLPKFLEPIIKSSYWPLIVGLPFLFSLLPTISKLVTGGGVQFISELDVYYSILTLAILGWVLWESFVKRRLKLLAYLSVVCIITTFAAQLFKLTSLEENQILFSAIFKTSLIMIFFALALSWVKDLTERIAIKSEDIYFHLSKVKTGRTFQNTLATRGILDGSTKTINLTNKNYDLLSRFVTKRKSGDWLEIKPKSDNRSGKSYDINDHNEIKRLLASVLDGIYGKELWSKTEHEQPLKAALFEISKEQERMIQLAIPADNCSIAAE